MKRLADFRDALYVQFTESPYDHTSKKRLFVTSGDTVIKATQQDWGVEVTVEAGTVSEAQVEKLAKADDMLDGALVTALKDEALAAQVFEAQAFLGLVGSRGRG